MTRVLFDDYIHHDEVLFLKKCGKTSTPRHLNVIDYSNIKEMVYPPMILKQGCYWHDN